MGTSIPVRGYRNMKKLLLILLLTWGAFGQTTVPLSTPAPTGVNNASVVVNGGSGANTYYYWFVTRFPIGVVSPTNPAVANSVGTLGGSTNVVLTWSLPQGGVNVDILKSTTNAFPGSCSACRLSAANTGASFTDSGQTLVAYTMASPVGTANAQGAVNNKDFTQPLIQFTPYLMAVSGIQFPDGSQLLTATGATIQKTGNTNIFVSAVIPYTAGICIEWDASGNARNAVSGLPCGAGGGGGTPGGANGTVQYNNAGAFGGFVVSGDGTLNTATGVLSVTRINGGVIPLSAPLLASDGSRQLISTTITTSGDLSGSLPAGPITVIGVRGASVPFSAPFIGTNGSGQLIASSLATSGDISGNLPGPITVNKINGSTTLFSATGSNGISVSATVSVGGTLVVSGPTLVTSSAALTNLRLIAGAGSQGEQATNIVIDVGLNSLALPGSVTTGVGGGVGGSLALIAGTTPVIVPNSGGWSAPGTITTSQLLQFPNAVTVAHSVMVIGAPSGNISSFVYKAIPNCPANALGFDQSTDTFACNSIAGGSGLQDPTNAVNGVLSRTALNTTIARTLTGTATHITITNGTGVAGDPVWDLPSGVSLPLPSLGVGYLSVTKTVGAAGSTVAGLLVTLDSSGNVATSTVSDTGVLGVAVSGVSPGNPVEIATRGTGTCIADNTTVIGDLMVVGTVTAGRCRDSGFSNPTSINLGTQIVGKALSVVTAGNAVSIQLYGGEASGTRVATGATPPLCAGGTSGALCLGFGSSVTAETQVGDIQGDTAYNDFSVQVNGGGAGILHHTQPGAIHQTAKTAAISTATLCASAAGACNQPGMYRIDWDFIETGTVCATPGPGAVTFLLTYTDSNSTAHTAMVMPMQNQTSATAIAVGNAFTFNATSIANSGASGSFNISSSGAVIQYATGYTACSSGTGTYQLDATVTRLQ